MALTFVEIKTEVLVGLYRHLADGDGQIWVRASDLTEFVSPGVSKGFIFKSLDSLKGEGLVDDGFDDYDNVIYSINDKGIVNAEKVIGDQFGILVNSGDIPASDRIVSLTHNQVNSLEEPIREIVDLLGKENAIPDDPGGRERLLGQIKAGRELLRSGTFRGYLFYVTIIGALNELIRRYQGHVIAMVAASLVDLLVKTVLQAS
ncbi:MAG: hypothetical protein QM605_07585 [Sphingobium sp.]